MNFFFSILIIIIISNKFFLFNEEFLILFSFICFCFVIYNKLAVQIRDRFQNKSSNIEKSLVVSLNVIYTNLLKKKQLNNELVNFKLIFISLKNYYLSFSLKFLNEFLFHVKSKKKIHFLTKLSTFSSLEKDYLKFIIFLLLTKLNQINLLSIFFSSLVKVKRFQTFSKINRLNLIKKI